MKGIIRNKNLFLVFGQFGLAVSLLLDRFVKKTTPVSFLIGLFTGLSIVFNIAFLIRYRKEKSQ